MPTYPKTVEELVKRGEKSNGYVDNLIQVIFTKFRPLSPGVYCLQDEW
tara:strand:- start:469 stop:612 length:144 start_codon:yes stop_codon:yes gene_type:complete